MPASIAVDGLRKPLRILMTADAAGGVWQYCVDLIVSLVADGAEVLLATMGPRPTAEQRQQLISLPRVTLAESEYALEWMPDAWNDVEAAGKWLLELESGFDPDVIHLNGYAHASLPWPKPTLVMAHSCVYSWWRAVHGSAPGPEWAEYKRRVLAGLSACEAIVAPSLSMARTLHDEYGVSSDNIRIIHNFTRAEISPALKKQPFVLAAGRVWDVAKNLELLDRIAPRLEWGVRIAGPGTPGHAAHFLGPLPHDELLDQMSAAGIFAHPALYEPFGLAILEAARAGCCLVLSDIPSLRELWDGAAVFLDPRQPDLWLRELNRLSHNPEERETFGGLARSHSNSYDADSSLKQYGDAYAALATSNTGVAA